MGEILFTMRDVESDWANFAEGDKEKFGLGKLALTAGGLAGTAGLAALGIKNRKGIGQAAGRVGQQIGGYRRRTKTGGQSFVRDEVTRAAAPEDVIPAGARRTAAPEDGIPADLRKSNNVPDYLKALAAPKPKSRMGPGFSRKKRVANFRRFK